MSKVKALLFVASMVPFVLGAQNLIKNGDAESDLENWDPAKVQVVTENPHSGKSCFKTNTVSVIGTAVIPVDGTKTYKYSGWFRNADDKKPTLYFGLSPMTADKKEIKALQVCVMPGTETALAAPCKPEDTIIKIKDGSKWNIKDKYSHIGFNADNSGEYKDLPNTNVAAPVIVKVEKKDNLWEVTLEQACGMTYAADINVRIHRDGGYMYTGYIENPLPSYARGPRCAWPFPDLVAPRRGGRWPSRRSPRRWPPTRESRAPAPIPGTGSRIPPSA